jgi:endonuclease G
MKSWLNPRMMARSLVLATLLAIFSSMALAASTACPEHYFGGQAPDFLNEKLSAETQEVCYEGFALIHSGVTRTSLTSSEHLTRERVSGPRPERKNAFHADPNIPPAKRSELEDYARTGYDRGHLAPSGDMADEQSQYESFSLANIIPQNPDNNRNLWEGIESAVRDLARKSGELHVVTGPIFYGSQLKRLNGRVLVPTYIFKAIYDPERNQAAAYLVKNAEGMRYTKISIADLEQLAGIAVFPKLADDVKRKPMDLPAPRAYSKKPGIEDPSIVPTAARKQKTEKTERQPQ